MALTRSIEDLRLLVEEAEIQAFHHHREKVRHNLRQLAGYERHFIKAGLQFFKMSWAQRDFLTDSFQRNEFLTFSRPEFRKSFLQVAYEARDNAIEAIRRADLEAADDFGILAQHYTGMLRTVSRTCWILRTDLAMVDQQELPTQEIDPEMYSQFRSFVLGVPEALRAITMGCSTEKEAFEGVINAIEEAHTNQDGSFQVSYEINNAYSRRVEYESKLKIHTMLKTVDSIVQSSKRDSKREVVMAEEILAQMEGLLRQVAAGHPRPSPSPVEFQLSLAIAETRYDGHSAEPADPKADIEEKEIAIVQRAIRLLQRYYMDAQ